MMSSTGNNVAAAFGTGPRPRVGAVGAPMFSPDETSEHPLYGLAGPAWKGELLKQSAHLGNWSDRYFVLKDRKLW